MLFLEFIYPFAMSSDLRISTTYRPQKHIVLVVVLYMAAFIAVNIKCLVHNKNKSTSFIR
jgi:hypothetical protein